MVQRQFYPLTSSVGSHSGSEIPPDKTNQTIKQNTAHSFFEACPQKNTCEYFLSTYNVPDMGIRDTHVLNVAIKMTQRSRWFFTPSLQVKKLRHTQKVTSAK